MITIYTLESSNNKGNIRYIGMTRTSIERRLISHLSEANCKLNIKTHKLNWIRTELNY